MDDRVFAKDERSREQFRVIADALEKIVDAIDFRIRHPASAQRPDRNRPREQGKAASAGREHHTAFFDEVQRAAKIPDRSRVIESV
jgi:hypothetical protein